MIKFGHASMASVCAVLLSAFAGGVQAEGELDCGPQFNRLTADNLIPSYKKIWEDRKAVTAFHYSLPVDFDQLEESADDIKLVQDCYRRLEVMLMPRAAEDDAEAQFVLGILLNDAYTPGLGGVPIVGGLGILDEVPHEGLQRAHYWLLQSDRLGHRDAAEPIIGLYQWSLHRSIVPNVGKLSDSPPYLWLPRPAEMESWLDEAGARDHPMAYAALADHFFLRATHAMHSDPAERKCLLEISDRYRDLFIQAAEAKQRSRPN